MVLGLICRLYEIEEEERRRQREAFVQQYNQTRLPRSRRTTACPQELEAICFGDWFRNRIAEANLDDDDNKLLLTAISFPPSQNGLTFTSMKAHGNHYRVMRCKGRDGTWRELSHLRDTDCQGYATFDSGLATTFHEHRRDQTGVALAKQTYVGVLTQILQLDYGPLLHSEPAIILKAKWVRSKWGPDSSGPSMKHDETGLWLANFNIPYPAAEKLDYVLPGQVEQVFFYPNEARTAWRHILHKEGRSRRVVEGIYDVEYNDLVDHHEVVEAELLAAANRAVPLEEGESLVVQQMVSRVTVESVEERIQDDIWEDEDDSEEE